MRSLWVGLLLAALGCGCETVPSGGAPTPAASRPNRTAATTGHQSMQPDQQVHGRIVTVNSQLRYVVMDFPLRSVPAVGQQLHVYREGQKVAEIKVTGPALDTTIAGDITAGEVQPGDELRED